MGGITREETMRFHHMAIFVADLEKAIRLWRDVLGFNLDVQKEIPDGTSDDPSVLCSTKLLEDTVKVRGARSKMALLSSDEGALIELQQFEVPQIRLTPPERLRHSDTGIHELGLQVENIDKLFKKIRAAGYETQTDYVWTSGEIGRSFLFYDGEGNMIQLYEQSKAASWV